MTDPTEPIEPPDPPLPSFDEWVHYCFTHGQNDFSGWGGLGAQDERARFLSIDPGTLATYLTRLFESPTFSADKYTDDQIAKATWFLFGIGSAYLGTVRKSPINPALQSRCIRSVATMYTDLFDRVCGTRGTDPDTDLCDKAAIDIAVYMIWDMDQLEGAVMFPDGGPLREVCIEVLQTILTRCRTSTCLISALHGIGHIYGHSRYKGDLDLCQRLEGIIDTFLASRSLPEWVREYAALARDGAVQ